VLGQEAAALAGSPARAVGTEPGADTGPEDTRRAARALRAQGVDLILFAGGDGTARDVLDAVGTGVPVLGVPAGVKMHSAVFGQTPQAAGDTAARFLAQGAAAALLREAEVLDIDEDGLRAGWVAPRLYGVALVPHARGLMQPAKAGARADDEAALDALAARLAREWPRGRLIVFGCGTTTRRLKRALGFDGTLLGIDVALDGRLIAADVDEARLLRLLGDRPATVVVSATGGQGFLFGRGNQQISAEVIRRVGRPNIMVVTGAAKLMALDPPVLRVDTGAAEVDAMLAGYIPVHTAPGQRMMMRIAA
jgi:predicted polyphosphate/ATP-dependent NAD kinase